MEGLIPTLPKAQLLVWLLQRQQFEGRRELSIQGMQRMGGVAWDSLPAVAYVLPMPPVLQSGLPFSQPLSPVTPLLLARGLLVSPALSPQSSCSPCLTLLCFSCTFDLLLPSLQWHPLLTLTVKL